MKWPIKIIISFFLIFFSGKIDFENFTGRNPGSSSHFKHPTTLQQQVANPSDKGSRYQVTPPFPEQGLELLFAEEKEDKSLKWILLKNAKIFPLCIRFVFGVSDAGATLANNTGNQPAKQPSLSTTQRLSLFQTFRI